MIHEGGSSTLERVEYWNTLCSEAFPEMGEVRSLAERPTTDQIQAPLLDIDVLGDEASLTFHRSRPTKQ